MKQIKKADWIILSILVFIGILMSLFIYMPRQQDGSYVEIRIDGIVSATYSLTESRQETIQTPWGRNTINIHNGKVSITDADCHDGVCIATKSICKHGESIVCLPHRLVLSVISSAHSSPSYDAVTGGAS